MGPGSDALRISKIALCFKNCALNEWMKITLGRVRTPYKALAKNLGTVSGRAGRAAARVTTELQG
jgi:hypothetical protein